MNSAHLQKPLIPAQAAIQPGFALARQRADDGNAE